MIVTRLKKKRIWIYASFNPLLSSKQDQWKGLTGNYLSSRTVHQAVRELLIQIINKQPDCPGRSSSGVVLPVITKNQTHCLFFTPADRTHSQALGFQNVTVIHELVVAVPHFVLRQWASSSVSKYLGEMPNPLSNRNKALSKKAGRNNVSVACCNPCVRRKSQEKGQ